MYVSIVVKAECHALDFLGRTEGGVNVSVCVVCVWLSNQRTQGHCV